MPQRERERERERERGCVYDLVCILTRLPSGPGGPVLPSGPCGPSGPFFPCVCVCVCVCVCACTCTIKGRSTIGLAHTNLTLKLIITKISTHT